MHSQISDEEIERILSGKDFEEEAAKEEQQREQKQLDISSGVNSMPPQLPRYLTFLSSSANPRDLLGIQAPGSVSPPISNGFRAVSSAGSLPFVARSLYQGTSPSSCLLPHFPRLPLRCASQQLNQILKKIFCYFSPTATR